MSFIDELNNLHLYDSTLLANAQAKRLKKLSLNYDPIKSPIIETANKKKALELELKAQLKSNQAKGHHRNNTVGQSSLRRASLAPLQKK